nr:mRNA decay activator protein ZFP36 [Pelodiscus sinensis]|eukprot:XP_006131493.1 mRNA decay activator protein ZFP36 [Pelodiscus sinensis]
MARSRGGYQRAFSACPVVLSDGAEPLEEDAGGTEVLWSLHSQWGWAPALPRTSLQRIPFQAERSASMIESCWEGAHTSSRYKTELCRTYEESGACKYGAKCQFAHGVRELRGLSRHPKYKTELCRTFHSAGFCPYGSRCHFIHNAEEQRQPLRLGGGSPAHCGFSLSPPPSASHSPLLPLPVGLAGPCCCHHPAGDSPCLAFQASAATTTVSQDGAGGTLAAPSAFAFPGQLLQRSLSCDSLSDQEDSGGSSGSESPGLRPGGHRLPIFSRLSVSD